MIFPILSSIIFFGYIITAVFIEWAIIYYTPAALLLLTTFSITNYFILSGKNRNKAGIEKISHLHSPDLISREETGIAPVTLQAWEGRDRLVTCEEKIVDQKNQIDQLLFHLSAFTDAVEKERVLSEIIKNKTENATLKLTDHVYGIVESGNNMSSHIAELLTEMTSGDHSLEKDVSSLLENIRSVQATIDKFNEIYHDFERDKSTVKQMVNDIEQYTHEISDMADQTNVLAINASIEAARVGNQGRGFAVISGEVQKLAHRSKNIADSIKNMVSRTAAAVTSSYETQSNRIQIAIGGLENTKSILGEIAGSLGPRIEDITAGTDNCHKLSKSIAENLDEVTVHLQYQDMVRQVLEHMIDYLYLLKKDAELAISPLEADRDLDTIADDMLKKLQSLFTTREEWEAFDNDSEIHGDIKSSSTTGTEHNNEIKGDVTLF